MITPVSNCTFCSRDRSEAWMKYSSKVAAQLNMAAWRLFYNWERRGSQLVKPDRSWRLKKPAVRELFTWKSDSGNHIQVQDSLVYACFFLLFFSFYSCLFHEQERMEASVSSSVFWFPQLHLCSATPRGCFVRFGFEADRPKVCAVTSVSPTL